MFHWSNKLLMMLYLVLFYSDYNEIDGTEARWMDINLSTMDLNLDWDRVEGAAGGDNGFGVENVSWVNLW